MASGMNAALPRAQLAPGLSIARVVTGLWQVADQERDGRTLDLQAAAAAMGAYADSGFDSFDMADHYGSAEEITGLMLAVRARDSVRVMTKWCPEPGPMNLDTARKAIERALARMRCERIDLMQFHWWSFDHPAWLDALDALQQLKREGLIGAIGLTNFDTDHLRVALGHGVDVATNQVCVSLLDARALGEMSTFAQQEGVRLLAYGTLAGGFLSDRWLGVAEPPRIDDWSKMKYRRFIDAAGGWAAYQRLLTGLNVVAQRHNVPLASVAMRWVLDQPAVAAIIVGARLTERQHRDETRDLWRFELDARDRQDIDAARAGLTRIAGDCGDEYRRPPFLTASGDLSHHLDAIAPAFRARAVPGKHRRWEVDSGSRWESLCGYARATRVGSRVLVSGTTATHGSGRVVCPGDPAGQTVYVLDKIAASLRALGADLSDVVRTRIYVRHAEHWEPIGRVHGRVFAANRPANTLLEISRLVGSDYLVEIEAEAELDPEAARLDPPVVQ